MRIFLAGVIGVRLIPLLVRDGHQIAGMTRSPGKAAALCELGAESVVCDVFATSALIQAVTAFGPELVMPQLSDRPIRLSGSLSTPPATTGAGPKGHATCWPPPRSSHLLHPACTRPCMRGWPDGSRQAPRGLGTFR